MSDKNIFLQEEKKEYGKLYADITYAIDNISPFLEREELNRKKFVKRIDVLKRYIDLIDSCASETSKGGLFKFLKSDNSLDMLKDYKRDNGETFSQLNKCSKCSCLNCSSPCCFDSCAGCRTGSYIGSCDHKRMNVTMQSNFTLDLTNDRTGLPDKYNVLATLQNCQDDKKYIIIQSVQQRNKFVLYYYPGIVEDTYGEIDDSEEFDLVVTTYEEAAI